MQFPYQNIVVLTGAGISAESGIRTFRAQDGLWEEHHIEDVATPEGYERNPELVQRFYNERRQQLHGVIEPNNAHLALARLEREIEGKVTVVTQNIDNLHERAGSQNIIHMHGELLKARCTTSGQVIDWPGDLNTEDLCHCCQIPSPIRPHIVWFGEMPIAMDKIHDVLVEADLFISIGTSGAVYPAAGFVHEASIYGAHTIEVNLEPSAVESEFAEKRYGKATELVPELVNELLA
ncbi:Sir2 family NAD+-dependent deacetylase [Veronia pacifica]|uniref:NAD-dependent protein deacylase n=1 Tax=Veronia pacifica TaxID=1080227 RepID=A0A1C3EES9_9GAMM|nr:Sir2 family NAD+-dependent deacetylase [Veronia pacifica]ODA31762.1 NAD-dependent protein deacylase [Veronia pacifica]